jgi:hypothetical protein
MRNYLVVICDGPNNTPSCFLGELGRGLRQGVRKRVNATRFTQRGAARVAKAYGPDAMVVSDTNRTLPFEV